MVNKENIFIVEVKYEAQEKDLEKLIVQKYENFKLFSPAFKNYNFHLGLASIHIINDELKEKALASGVIVLQRRGNELCIHIPNNFQENSAIASM